MFYEFITNYLILQFVFNEILKNNVVYLNFSDIGDNMVYLLHLIPAIDQNNFKNLIISFSYVRGAHQSTQDLIRYLENFKFKLLIQRSYFVTYQHD